MESGSRVQILDKGACVSLRAYASRNYMNSSLPRPAIVTPALIRQPVYEKEMSEFKISVLPLEIDLVSHFDRSGGVT